MKKMSAAGAALPFDEIKAQSHALFNGKQPISANFGKMLINLGFSAIDKQIHRTGEIVPENNVRNGDFRTKYQKPDFS